MAKVTADLPRPTEVIKVDSQDFVGDEPPQIDPHSGAPKELRAYIVVKDPQITVVPHFFSAQECDHLLQLVEGYWMPSLVGQATYSSEEDYGKGDLENTLSTTRTSWSCMMRYSQTSVVERLEHRLSKLAGLPLENLERMNMVRYAPGERFDEHHDGKFRPVTIFVYLNNLPEEEAGDTYFPVLGLSFRPRRGTAIMWSNIANEMEDSRMLHCGRAPTKGVKYGVNCFFNIKEMRQLMQTAADIPSEEAATVHVADLVAKGSGNDSAETDRVEKKLVAYRLCPDPKVVAVPDFLSDAEVEALLELVGSADCIGGLEVATGGLFSAGTKTLRLLGLDETPMIQAIEHRLAATAGLPLTYLGALRVVSVGTRAGLCNRGCGPKSAFICLSKRDEVFFTRLGMRVVVRRGDMLMWPNVNWDTGQAVEDIRTLHVHVCGENGTGCPAIGIDAFFHDNPLREQQKQRLFIADPVASPAIQQN